MTLGAAALATPSSPTRNHHKAPLPILSPTPSVDGSTIVEASFCQDEHDDDEYEKDDTTTTTTPKSTFWNLLCTMYLPILFLWLRRSMFGTANLLRSLLLGHLLRMLFSMFSTDLEKLHWWDTVTQHPMIQPLFQKDPHAWPPPALVLLACLTIIAFCLHPDGLTWIMLNKTRDGLFSLVCSLGSCLGNMKDTYGIIPTVFALATLAALAFVLWIIYKACVPKKRPAPVPTKKKKGKKKGRQRQRHHHGHHHHGRKKQPVKQQQMEKESTTTTTTVQKEQPVSESSAPRPPPVVSEKPSRTRFMSASTLDTCPLLDDQSCDDGSTSVRSISSAPTSVSKIPTTPTVLEQGNQLKVLHSKSKRKPGKKKHNARKTALLEPPSPTLSASSAPARSTVESNRRKPRTNDDFSFFSGSSSSFFSQQQPTTVRYSVPAYGAGDGRYTPGKMELAAFLARVGLVGAACADLLQDLPNVEALANLTSRELELRYGIFAQKQREIQLLLEARRQVRPPPGYSVDTSCVSIGAANYSSSNHNNNTLGSMYNHGSSTGGAPPGLNMTNSSTVGNVTMMNTNTSALDSSIPLTTNVNHGSIMENSTAGPPCLSDTGIPSTTVKETPANNAPFLPSTALQIPPHGQQLSLTSALACNHTSCLDEEEIEQELQELGGQMVTSVLDF